MNYIDEYNKLKNSQPEISNQNFKVLKAKNVFTDEQIKEIYYIIDKTKIEDTHLQEWAGHRAWNITFPKSIEDTITKAAREVLGDGVILDGDYSFARYTPEWGVECKLFPHYDTRDTQRITFDIQLNADEPWGIVVENEMYSLENNQALIFAGTQQIHWREKKKLKPNTKIDMVFCHLKHVVPLPYDNNQIEILEERSKFLMDATGINSSVEPYSV